MNNFKIGITLLLCMQMILSVAFVSYAEDKAFKSEKLNRLHYIDNYVVASPFPETQALDHAVGVEDGLNVMYVTSSAKPAIFNVFDLDNMVLLRSFELQGSASSAEHIIDKNGNVYIITTDKARLFRYSPVTKELRDLGSIDGQSAAYQSVFDEEGNLYIGTYPSGAIVKYDPVKEKFESLGQIYPGNIYIRSLSYHNGYLYAGSNGTGDALIVRVDPKTGERKNFPVPIQPDKFTEVTNVYTQTNLGRYNLTYGANGKGNNCWMVFDYQEEKWTDIVVTQAGGGMFGSPVINGKSYFNTANGMKTFDINTKEIADTNIPNAFTGRKYYIVDFKEGLFEGFSKNTLVTVSYDCRPIFVNIETGKVQTMTQAEMKGGHLSLQHIATGPNNTVYIGGYLGSRSALYNPQNGEIDYIPMGQTENIKMVGDKMYFGAYPTGYVYEYDPLQPTTKTNPNVIMDIKNDQDRPYIIDGDENYIAAGSIATYGKLGGALTIYDKRTKTYEVFRNVVENQSVVGLAVKDGLVYGSTTVSGGLGIVPVEKEAKIFVWDIENKKKIKEFIPDWPEEMKSLKDPVKIIGDLEFGPDGLIWGASQGYIFAMEPITCKIVKSKVVGNFNYAGDGHFWMPIHIRFDQEGLLYASVDYGIVLDPETMEYISIEPYSKYKSNIMDVDLEGNIYFGQVGTFRKIARTPVVVSDKDKEQIYQKLNDTIALALNQETAIAKNNITVIDSENSTVRPITIDGRTMLPVRFVAESLNAEVIWNEADATAVLTLPETKVEVPVGKKEIIVNGIKKEIDVPAQVRNGRTLLPLRALAEALGKEVFWDEIGLIVVSDKTDLFDPIRDREWIDKTYYYIKNYGPVDYAKRLEMEKREKEIAKEQQLTGRIELSNSDFEEGIPNGNVPGWTPMNPNLGEEMLIQISSEKSYSGKQSLLLQDTSTTQRLGVMSDPIRVKKNARYNLKVKLFIESGRTSVLMQFYDEYLNEIQSVSENVQTGQGSWQEISIYAIPPTDAKYLRVQLVCSNLWLTRSYYDYVRLYKE